MDNKRVTGAKYEDMAANHLKELGYEILEMNFRCRIGEIDLIAKEKEYLVFIEVKYRATSENGLPEEAVNFRKQKVISKVANYYLMRRQNRLEIPVRFDVVSILGNEITVYRNAFDYCV